MWRPNSEEDQLSLIDWNHAGRRAYVSMIGLLLCSTLMAGLLDVRAVPTASGQIAIDPLHVPELDTGFHLLYELKPEEARAASLRPGRSPTRQTPLGAPRKRQLTCLRSATVRAF